VWEGEVLLLKPERIILKTISVDHIVCIENTGLNYCEVPTVETIAQEAAGYIGIR